MLNSLAVHLLWRSFNWLTRRVIVALSTIVVLIALTIIVLRYWVLPDIEQYHDQITASLAYAIGNPVTIGKIEGDWQGFQPRLEFSDVRILDEQRLPALVLQRIDGSVSWMSLLTAELRLASLEIDKPELLVRRDVHGKVFIGGVELSKKSGSNDLADWLLHQSRMVVRDALIVWVDEFRDAPPLVLRQVNLHIENQFSHHRFALRALPPEELATPLDVRGDFHGASFENLEEWRGNIFTQLDFTDLTAWRSWLDLPREFNLGRGALRGWMNIEAGKVNGITADLALYNVVAKLGKDVPELVLANLRGRAEWQEVKGGFEVSTKGLALRLQNGIELQSTDFYFSTVKAAGDEQPAGGEVRANLLQLENLAGLANFLPLDAGLRAQLDAYAPRGRVANLNVRWQGTLEKPDNFRINGRFENLAIRQVGKMPGFSGLTVDVNGSDASGRLNINAHQMVVDAPGVMREPIPFATLTGQVSWQRKGGELLINASNVAVVNDDLAGNLQGSYLTQAGTLGVLDLTANLTRGDVRRAARYTPLIALNREGNDWLNGALLDGHTEDFRIRIKGNLSDFPPGGGKNVQFEIGGHARNAVLEFAKDWPRIENITGEFLIRGSKLEVISTSATMAGAYLQNVTVSMPDMMSKDLALEIKGEAVAPGNTFLQFIQKSPVRGYIDGFTDGMRASGNGHLDLFVRLPLQGGNPVKVSGTVGVQDSDIDLGEGVPLLRKTRGALSFTESGMQASGVSSEILGGTAVVNMQSGAGGAVHATAQGHINIDVLRKSEPLPLLNYLHGSTAWDADISVVKKSAQVIINSSLQGIRSSLPEPFAKRASETMPLRVEKKPVLSLSKRPVLEIDTQRLDAAVGQDIVTVQLGKLLDANLVSGYEHGLNVIKRGTIIFGGQGKQAGTRKARKPRRAKDGPLRQSSGQASAKLRTGVWLAGSLPELSMQGWGGLTGGEGKTGPAIPIAGANLDIEKLTGYGQNISALHIDAGKRGDGLAARLSSSALNGEVVWQPHGFETGGKLSARLRNLQWQWDNKQLPVQPDHSRRTNGEPAGMLRPGDLPALDFAVENLQLAGKQIGRFELVGYPDKSDWRLRRLHITNPDGDLLGDGVWHGTPGITQTQINLLLEISDAGKILARSGKPNAVKGGSGKLAANLSWAGGPDEFDYATLNGTLKLDTGKGRFIKMDPGIGKLLSILSLQALPRHVTLDFNDVFSEGFQFDSINGNAAIKNGVIDTQDFHMDGSSAKVTMKGSVDLNHETQNLRVKVLPTIGDSVSLGVAFAAGPAVGVGALILNKVLGNPLDKLVSFEYNVSGTWSDPNVVKIGGVQTQAKENPKESPAQRK
jgi:uncharacterized protein YhdP